MVQNIRTDMAVECIGKTGEQLPDGVKKVDETVGNVSVTRIEIQTEAAAKTVGKPIGNYFTLETTPFRAAPSDFEEEAEAVAGELRRLLPEGAVLVVGLGNSGITPDALGPEVINSIFSTRHLVDHLKQFTGFENLRSVAALAPGVLGQTGVETAEIVQALVKEIAPAGVIVIDALASREISRLGATVQIADTGIAPGSGVANHRKALNQESLGVPVIAVGVPTVVDMNTIAEEMLGEENLNLPERGKQMMVTPREIDTIILNAAKTIAFGINLALQPDLGVEDILALIH